MALRDDIRRALSDQSISEAEAQAVFNTAIAQGISPAQIAQEANAAGLPISAGEVQQYIDQNRAQLDAGYQATRPITPQARPNNPNQPTPQGPVNPNQPRFDSNVVPTINPNRPDPSNSDFSPLHMETVQALANERTALQNIIANNPNYIGPGGSTQTTSFGQMPDYEAYVRNNPDLIDDFLNNQHMHGIQNIVDYGKFHYSRTGANEGRNLPTADASTLGYLQPEVRTQLSPEEQAIFDTNQRSRSAMAAIGESQLGSVNQSLNTPFGFEGMADPSTFISEEGLPDRPGIQDRTIDPTVGGMNQIRDAIVGRNQHRLDQEREQTINDLMIQGHNPGSQAWNDRMLDLAQKENDFELAAQLQAGNEQARLFGMESAGRQQDFDMGNMARDLAIGEKELGYGITKDLRNQQIREAMMQRQVPLNELNALRTGSQVAMPGQQPYNAFGMQGPDYASAAQEQYNRNFAQSQQKRGDRNMMTQGLFQLGGATMGAAGQAGGFGQLFGWG